MSHSTLVKNLSKKEKIELMEELWSSLREPNEEYELPEWHLSELKKREERIRNNEESFSDWNEVKKEIKNAKK